MGTKKSVNVTAIETSPLVHLHGKRGGLEGVVDTVELATTDIDSASNDVILLMPLKSSDRLFRFEIFSDDLDSNVSPALAYDIGLYYSGVGNGQMALGKVSGDVVDADCIGTAVTVGQAASTTGGELRFEAADIADIGKTLWELGGLSSDPGGVFYIGLDITTAAATAAAGTLTVRAMVM